MWLYTVTEFKYDEKYCICFTINPILKVYNNIWNYLLVIRNNKFYLNNMIWINMRWVVLHSINYITMAIIILYIFDICPNTSNLHLSFKYSKKYYIILLYYFKSSKKVNTLTFIQLL